MRTRTNTIEVESNGKEVWILLKGKEKMRLSLEDFINLLDACKRMNTEIAKNN